MLKRTPLFNVYKDMEGIKLVDFGGWEMPIQFKNGIISEHNAVRSNAGLFDVSHMGEISVEGPDAAEFIDILVTNRISGVQPGKCIYTPMCYENGTTVDDLLVYVLEPDFYLLVVNAANTDKDFEWIKSNLEKTGKDVTINNVSADWAQIALQGSDSVKILSGFTEDFNPDSIEYYTHAGFISVAGCQVLLSRTGYTGEDGFEIYSSPEDAPVIWNTLLKAGAQPCGLGARDILRLEAAFPLYGHELTDKITPMEAGLGMFVKLDKPDFNGKSVLLSMKKNGIPNRIYALKMIEPAVPREGYKVYQAEDSADNADNSRKPLGYITSGGKSPALNEFIALGLLENGKVKPGDTVFLEIRGKLKKAEIVKKPFYKR